MKKTILFVLFSLSLFSASARVFSIRATLNGANVVPANTTTGTGTFNGTIDDATGLLSFTVTYTGLSSAVSTSRLYVGAAGINGTQIANFGVIPSTFSASQILNATQVTDLLNGNIYFQIHTSNNTGGEIRGQLAIFMEIFSLTNQNDFYNIGGYSFFESSFTNISSQNPFTLSGPLPLNNFTFAAASPQGFNGNGLILTKVPNQPVIITFPSNNIRKMSFLLSTTGENILVKANTNLGNSSSFLAGDLSSEFVGFNLLTENEYITQVEFAAPVGINTSLAIYELSIGDNSPQNVSLYFDGVNDFVSIPSSVGNFDYNQAFTVTCWVKPTADQPGGTLDVAILEKWNQTGPYPFVIRLLTSGADAGKVRVARFDGTNNPAFNSITTINDGKWHHIAFTSGGSGTGLRLYIDGMEQDMPTTDITTDITTNTSPLFVGQRGNGINRFKGEIDEVRIWTVAKAQSEIQNEMFCKNPITTNLQAAYNFSNGVPNGSNALITQVQDILGVNHGTLNNFSKTGDVSNFVTGQVKYVNKNAPGTNNGNTWANAFNDLQSALFPNTCNDLVEVYVATGTYRPASFSTATSYDIPAGMKIYGGFAGTEKNINERNMVLIHTANKTTLSGDLGGNDLAFNFASNRTDNSHRVVGIFTSNVTFDGFTVRGGQFDGIRKGNSGGIRISNSRFIDNDNGLYLVDGSSTVSNCLVAGNNIRGIYIFRTSTNFQNCVVVNNAGTGINQNSDELNATLSNFTNCTIASNGGEGISNNSVEFDMEIENYIKNTIIKDNAGDGIVDVGVGVTTNNITYSLVQGVTSGTGNLDGNTVNPQFVSPLGNSVRSDTGDYRLKDSSPCINVGTDGGVSPLDLDRSPRPRGGKTDMGAYESNINMNEIISIATGNWEAPATWNLNRVPLATDKVIMNGHTVTVTTNTAKAKIVEQKPSSDLKFNAGGSLELKQ